MLRKCSFAVFIFIIILVFSTGAEAVSENQAPELQQAVREGEIEPLEERLPENPLVIETYEEIGQYGGTWNRLTDDTSWIMFHNVIDGYNFVRFSDREGMDPVPNLIKDWDVDEEMTNYTFYFRKGLKWSDGESLTADDFMFYWEDMVLNEEIPVYPPQWATVGGEMMEVTKIDEYTIEMNFPQPNVTLIEELATWPGQWWEAYIFPKHYLKQFHPDFSDEHDTHETFQEKQHWRENAGRPVLNAWKPVEIEMGDYLRLERNPYYFAVDSEGNQLPYIDEVFIDYAEDPEIIKLRATTGDVDMQIRPNVFTPADVHLLRQNEEEHGIKTLMWEGGSGTGPVFIFNHNHEDPGKRELYRSSNFLKGLSHAVNRDRINRIVYYDMGEPTTGTYNKNTADLDDELYKEWRDSAVEYDPEKSSELLDEIGVIDHTGDGWRDRPDGGELVLMMNLPPHIDTAVAELVQEDWQEAGIRTEINTMDEEILLPEWMDGKLDIRVYMGMSYGASVAAEPLWMIGGAPDYWAPLYGRYELIRHQHDLIEDQADMDPHDREPPHKEPEEGGSVYRLRQLLREAEDTADEAERKELVGEMVKIHIEDGPFAIGTVGNIPAIGVVNQQMKNVPEDLEHLWAEAWSFGLPGAVDPHQFFFEE